MIYDGTQLRINLDSAVVLYATNCQLSLSREMKQTVHKDGGGNGVWAEYYAGFISGTVNHSGFLATDGLAEGYWSDFVAGNSVAWEFTNGVSTNYEWAGAGLISGFNVEAPVADPTTYELPLQISGAVTYTAIV